MEKAVLNRPADYGAGGGVSRRGTVGTRPYPSRNVKLGLIRATRRAGSQQA